MSTEITDGPVKSSKFARPYSVIIVQLLMGLMFTLFGLNGFLHFLPQPKDAMPPGASAFAGAMMQTHYFFSIVFGTQLIVGILLLINRFVPLALALIAPVIVNIIAFHVFLAPSGLAPGVVVTLFELYLVWSYRQAFLPMLTAKTELH